MSDQMTWQEICSAYPKTYVVLKDYQEEQVQEDKIKILGGEVTFSSPDSKEVYHQYNSQKNGQHVIFGYTGWESFEVEERLYLGLRPSHD